MMKKLVFLSALLFTSANAIANEADYELDPEFLEYSVANWYPKAKQMVSHLLLPEYQEQWTWQMIASLPKISADIDVDSDFDEPMDFEGKGRYNLVRSTIGDVSGGQVVGHGSLNAPDYIEIGVSKLETLGQYLNTDELIPEQELVGITSNCNLDTTLVSKDDTRNISFARQSVYRWDTSNGQPLYVAKIEWSRNNLAQIYHFASQTFDSEASITYLFAQTPQKLAQALTEHGWAENKKGKKIVCRVSEK